jgi:hypothetical protein
MLLLGLSQMGKGFDWVTGASGRQVVDFNQKVSHTTLTTQ